MSAPLWLRWLCAPVLPCAAVVVLFGCSRSAPAPVQASGQDAATAAASPAPVPDPAPAATECTLATPLVPGIPGSPGHLIPSPRNPNGQSELSAHMRRMEADLSAARAALQGGTPVAPMLARHRKIRCSWPTNPSDRDAAFDASARGYLDAVAALDAASPDHKARAYDGVLSACRTCHEHTCSGAIVAIEALRMAASAQSAP